MKLRSNKPAVLAALAAGTILGGWPDRITVQVSRAVVILFRISNNSGGVIDFNAPI